jgi:hypothetical protein
MFMSNVKPILLKATVYWAELHKLNKFSNKYQVQLGNLSPAAVEALSEIGLEARNKGDDRGFFITCKSKYPIIAKTKDGVEIPEDVLIGNGSTAVALVGGYEWKTPTGEKGTSPALSKLNITELVEYEDEPVDEAAAL